MNERLVLISLAVVGLSGVPGLVLARRTQASQVFCTLLACGGCVGGIWGTVECLLDGTTPLIWDWFLPIGRFSISLDTLSCIFLLPLFVVSLVGSIYGLGYWPQGKPAEEPQWANLFAETWPGYWQKSDHSATGPRLRCFYGTLTAAMGLLVIARDGVLFLMSWEVMALSAFFLVTTEDDDDDVVAAGWLFLAASHFATLLLFGMFSLLYRVHGSFDIAAVTPDQASPAMLTAIFLLALGGFGLKAGIMPLHIWLPSAHASAPSHVSALMSGVLIKMGVYGLVRVTSLLPNPPLWWGLTLLALGAVSGILALVLAIGQLDIKRTLAYSSIENIGVIFMGLGLALAGRAQGKLEWTILGMGGVLLHVWNHALFKSLLFYCAGSVIHATGTRSLDLMGGLAKSMRWTSLAFLIGALAACGLPPMSGFVSELFIYLGLFKNLVVSDEVRVLRGVSFAAAALAMVGALAVACFVQLYGVVFLGSGRSHATEHAHESPTSMLVPLLLPIVGSIVIGVAPLAVIGVIDRGVAAWLEPAPAAAELVSAQAVSLESLAPLSWISGIALLLAGLLAVVAGVFRWRLNAAPVGASGTWDCGYAQPTARMQYTAASFAEILVQLFAWILRPKVSGPRVSGLFPQKASFYIQVVDIVLNRIVEPVTDFLASWFARLRLLQQGVVQVYLLYIFLIIVALLVWA
jgi:hydrogenase-4 component B